MTLEEFRAEATAKATKEAETLAERRIGAAAERDRKEQARELVRNGDENGNRFAGFRDAMRAVPKATPRVEITEIGDDTLPPQPQSASTSGEDDPSGTTVDLELCDGTVVRVLGEIVPP